MSQLRDIRDHLPKTAQTDPNKFPPYEYRPYPRMMKDENGKPLKNAIGQPVIVNSEVEEVTFLGKEPKEVKANIVSVNPVAALTAAPDQEKRKPGRPAKVHLPEPLTD